jgi:hypothetical protein
MRSEMFGIACLLSVVSLLAALWFNDDDRAAT